LELFLFETEEDFENYKNQIGKKEPQNIIALSTKTHKILKKNCISHQVIDDFFTVDDYNKIDKIMINFSLNWYKQKEIDLEIEGLNLGYLLETEIVHYFLTLVRYVIGLKKIIEEKNPTKLFVGNISPIIKSIILEKKIMIIEKKTDKKLKLDRDEIEIPIPLLKSRKIKISRNQFNKTKNFIEKISTQSFTNKNLNQKSILLLDFNPVFYKQLLKNLSDKFDNVYLLNQRRPAIWNLQSLKIIKQYKCKILKFDDYNDSISKNEITIKSKELENKIAELEYNYSLKEFFKIDNVILWDVIKDEFIDILSKRSHEMVLRKTVIRKIFEEIPISIVFEWSYKGFEERIVNNQALLKQIPIVFLQHSIIVENSEFDIFLPFQPTLPDNKSRIAVYGNTSYNFIKNKKIPDSQILTTGSPRHDEFFNNKSSKKNNSVVLATASTFPKYKASGNNIRSYDKLETIIKNVLDVVKKHSDKKLIIKLHPRTDYDDIASYIRKINKDIPIYKDQKSLDVIKNCDVLISTNFSTILLEGMILGKPTIMISDIDFQNESIVKKNATVFVTKIEDVEDALNKILSDESFREKLIKNGDDYIKEYFTHHGKASENLTRELLKIS
jgi:glycosyltransferase involved in cell wall biosynthesis